MVYFLFYDKYNIKSILLLEKFKIDSIFVCIKKKWILNFILDISLYKNFSCFFLSKKLFFSFFSKKNNIGVVIFLKNNFLFKKDILFFLYKLLNCKDFSCIVLHNLQNSFNFGSCFRSIAAVGISIVFISGNLSCPITYYSVKNSCGSICFLLIFRIINIITILNFLFKFNVFILSIVQNAKKTLYSNIYVKKIAFIFGSEYNGLSKFVINRCSECISVPMLSFINSLNVSCTLSIILYEVVRQRFFIFVK